MDKERMMYIWTDTNNQTLQHHFHTTLRQLT